MNQRRRSHFFGRQTQICFSTLYNLATGHSASWRLRNLFVTEALVRVWVESGWSPNSCMRARARERERERDTKNALRPEREKEIENERKYSNEVGQGLDGLWPKFIAAVHHWCNVRKQTNRFSDKAVLHASDRQTHLFVFLWGGGGSCSELSL